MAGTTVPSSMEGHSLLFKACGDANFGIESGVVCGSVGFGTGSGAICGCVGCRICSSCLGFCLESVFVLVDFDLTLVFFWTISSSISASSSFLA